MKATSIFAAGFILLLSAAFTATAQDISSPVIKLLPSEKPSSIKLLVAESDGNSVEVKFYDDKGMITFDDIAASKAGKGFLKRYDFQKLPMETAIWMSVKASNTVVVYKITRANDSIESRLEEATYSYPVVAAR